MNYMYVLSFVVGDVFRVTMARGNEERFHYLLRFGLLMNLLQT